MLNTSVEHACRGRQSAAARRARTRANCGQERQAATHRPSVSIVSTVSQVGSGVALYSRPVTAARPEYQLLPVSSEGGAGGAGAPAGESAESRRGE